MLYSTPNVYIEEKPLLPPSVAHSETAIPVFIGYTEKGYPTEQSPSHKPVRVTNMAEYKKHFGRMWRGDLKEFKSRNAQEIEEKLKGERSELSDYSPGYLLYHQVKMFFTNGGGACYVISIGEYVRDGEEATIEKKGFINALSELKKESEPTLILLTDAVNLETDDYGEVCQAALRLCEERKNLFAILDVQHEENKELDELVEAFKDNIGQQNLKYGAGYLPYLKTTFPFPSPELERNYSLIINGVKLLTYKRSGSPSLEVRLATSASMTILDHDAQTAIDQAKARASAAEDVLNNFKREQQKHIFATDEDALSSAVGKAKQKISKGTTQTQNAAFAAIDEISKAMQESVNDGSEASFVIKLGEGIVDKLKSDAKQAVKQAKDAQSKKAPASRAVMGENGLIIFEAHDEGLLTLDNLIDALNGSDDLKAEFTDLAKKSDKTKEIKLKEQTYPFLPEEDPKYNKTKENLSEVRLILPPSGAIAGVYASVDRDRGVWKAPANVSLSGVIRPTLKIGEDEQARLNVDAATGKSINVIRSFKGMGTLVWGSRTLAGSDNEWRYVPVRRLFNAIEGDLKVGTRFAIFEPNNEMTWLKVKIMIENYLNDLWKKGAFAGSTPEAAYFVQIGTETMTQQDILEGRMIVKIGLAAVRPAEFVILQFSHMLQTL